jgi:hypothetical protein
MQNKNLEQNDPEYHRFKTYTEPQWRTLKPSSFTGTQTTPEKPIISQQQELDTMQKIIDLSSSNEEAVKYWTERLQASKEEVQTTQPPQPPTPTKRSFIEIPFPKEGCPKILINGEPIEKKATHQDQES